MVAGIPRTMVNNAKQVPQKSPPVIGVPGLPQLQQQRQQTLAEIHRRGGVAKTPGFANKLNTINSQIRTMRNNPTPAQTPEMSDPAIGVNEPAPAPSTPAPSNPPASPEATSALYPSLNYQLPENYQGSPMYKWQMEQGTKALDRRLAAQGLSNSGAEIDGLNQLSSSVGAQESDRLRQDAQTEADRYERVTANEAARQERQGTNQWSRLMDVLNLSTRQSPMDYAYKGMDSYANTGMDRGKAKSNNVANNYTRVSAGPGRSVAPFTPPAPSGPDYSNVNLLGALLGNNNSRNTGSLIDSVLSGIGSFF